jgi:hypothetical protein
MSNLLGAVYPRFMHRLQNVQVEIQVEFNANAVLTKIHFDINMGWQVCEDTPSLRKEPVNEQRRQVTLGYVIGGGMGGPMPSLWRDW